jgi:Tfp pilus assembly protein PilF
VVGIRVDVPIDAAQRREEKRKIARQNYRRATTCLTQMDYSLAVELLKEAARMDPRAEYFALLGQAQSKNPHWQSHALGSFQRAIELDPDDAGYRYSYGKLLEEMDRMDEAREQYAIALDLRPDHPEAGDALERLGGRRSVARQLSSKTGNFRSLFGKSAKE